MTTVRPTQTTNADLDVSSCGHVTAKKTFQYAGGAGGFASTTMSSLPPYSITVVDLTLSKEP